MVLKDIGLAKKYEVLWKRDSRREEYTYLKRCIPQKLKLKKEYTFVQTRVYHWKIVVWSIFYKSSMEYVHKSSMEYVQKK